MILISSARTEMPMATVLLIDLTGALLPLWMIYAIYNYALTYVSDRFSILSNFLDFLPVEKLFEVLTPVSVIVGVGIGFFGSITTVRKHLHV